jgi:hypothetical protein
MSSSTDADYLGTRIEVLGLTKSGLARKYLQVFTGWKDPGPIGPERIVLSISAKNAKRPAAVVHLGPRQALELAGILIRAASQIFPEHVEAKEEF